MKQKQLLLLSILLAAIGFYVVSAIRAKRRSDDLLARFKKVEADLSEYKDSADLSTDTLLTNSPFIVGYKQIVFLIDSIKEQYHALADEPNLVSPTPQMESDIKRMLKYIQVANKMEWDIVDSRIPDTIKYWPEPTPFIADKWYAEFFVNQYKITSVTYLAYLKSEAMKHLPRRAH